MQNRTEPIMRIHFPSYGISENEKSLIHNIARQALQECKDVGTVAKHVSFKVLTSHRRSGPGSALEVQLEAAVRDRGRRAGNSGSYGAGNGYAATHDEWGFFLAALYRLAGEDLIVGSGKFKTYLDASDFHEKTGRTYDPAYIDYVGKYGDDYLYRDGQKRIGRRGAGRVHYDSTATRYATEDPRTADWLRDFQAGKTY